jgi:hypothetical protein
MGCYFEFGTKRLINVTLILSFWIFGTSNFDEDIVIFRLLRTNRDSREPHCPQPLADKTSPVKEKCCFAGLSHQRQAFAVTSEGHHFWQISRNWLPSQSKPEFGHFQVDIQKKKTEDDAEPQNRPPQGLRP